MNLAKVIKQIDRFLEEDLDKQEKKMLESVYASFNAEMIKLNNSTFSNKKLSTEFRLGFQSATMAAFQVLLNIKDREVTKNENKQRKTNGSSK